jgi:rfaE bifunctional protein kinase chain/domain
VAWNVAELGARCIALTILGKDAFGEILRELLAQKGVDRRLILDDPARRTPSFEKIRVSDGGISREERWDVVNRRPISRDIEARYAAALEAAAGALDCLIVADYDEAGSGILTPRVLESIAEIGRRNRIRLLATSRLRIGAFRPATAVVNEYEAAMAAGLAGVSLFEPVDDESLDRAGRDLARWNDRTAFVTAGKSGMIVYEPNGKNTRVPTVEAAGEIDIVGAGDTALAALAASLCAGASPVEAAAMGNVAANVTIRKIGITGAASPEEILRNFDAYFANAARLNGEN